MPPTAEAPPEPAPIPAIDVVDDAERAQALLNPARRALLEALDEPASAAALARRLDLPRQRLNYHLRELERHGLVELADETRRGSVVERVYRRTADAYAISTAALGGLGTTPEEVADRLSAAYLIALASRAVRELGALQPAAAAAGQRLPTLSLEVDVRFASATERSAFAEELATCVAELARKYHDESAPGGRTFRFLAAGYPRPKA